MDIFDILKREHKTIEKIFTRLQDAEDLDADECEELVGELQRELLAHTIAEQKAFYEPLEEREGMEDLIAEAKEEHALVDKLVNEFADMEMEEDEEAWMAKRDVLQENVMHHVEEEESEMFDRAKKAIEEDEASSMAEAFEKEKAAALQSME